MRLDSPVPDEPPVIQPLNFDRRNGFSSTAAMGQPSAVPTPPLPYPDDDQTQPIQVPSSTNGSIPQSLKSGPGRVASPSKNTRAGSPSQGSVTSAQTLFNYPRPQKKQATLAERRGAVPKPLPNSTGSVSPDKEPYWRNYQRAATGPVAGPQPDANSHSGSQQQFWPPPRASTGPAATKVAAQNYLAPDNSINRNSSLMSISTTRAERGSPPPPETPVVGPDDQLDIGARFTAARITGSHALGGLQAQNAAAQRRAGPYAGQQPRNQPPLQRPWTPTEEPGSQPHGPPTVYQGPGVVAAENQVTNLQGQTNHQASRTAQLTAIPQNALEREMERMHIASSPPPSYSSVSTPTVSEAFQNEKQRLAASMTQNGPTHPALAASTATTVAPQDHPAFANGPRQLIADQSRPASVQHGHPTVQQAQFQSPPASAGLPPPPPPLPEGWIAHLDSNSGQYYYIHLPTQATQWEFPKGPTPLNLTEVPLSPVGSVYSAHPLKSPGISAFSKPLMTPGPMSPGPMSPGGDSLQSPIVAGFMGLPPSSGVDLYRVAPMNGVYFGPYLRYTNMDLERGLWLGSILLVTDAAQPPTIHIHQSVDLSPNPRQLKPASIAVHQRWTFYKYDIDLQMEDFGAAKWTYAVTSHLGCTRYEFLVAGRYENNWRLIATSNNDFSLNVNANERSRLGGVGYMWKDIVQKHDEIGGFHAQLCLGGQIYADRMWKEIPSLKQWLATSGKETRKNAPWTAAHEEDVSHAYFHYYTSHFDQPHLREAFAQIPYLCQIDDHDIFDGFGSYPEHMQFSNMFKNIGRIGVQMYLLFQHHTTLDILRKSSTDTDLFTITGTGWHFVKYLGPAVAVVGVDCRSERNPHQVIAGPTYQGLFPKVVLLPPSVQHCIWMISTPLIYPRLETAEHLAQTVATGKRAVTGAYNVLGKVTSSVAGVIGAKEAVGSGFDSVKRVVGKSGLMGGLLSPFGELGVLDELRDQWTHESKDLERTYLIRTLQGIAHQKSLRMTFLSGNVNVCGAGMVYDPAHPLDHKTMYQIIASPVVNNPPPSYMLRLLHGSEKQLYIPANGQRSTPTKPSDTKEEMLDVFQMDMNGQPREQRRLMGRRNYVAIVAYDPDAVSAAYGRTDTGQGSGKLSLSVDFMVQGDGTYGNVVKYGPVVIPRLAQGK